MLFSFFFFCFVFGELGVFVCRLITLVWFIFGGEQCREAGLSYRGKFFADVCFQWEGGAVIREKFNFGYIPIMLKVCTCLFPVAFT